MNGVSGDILVVGAGPTGLTAALELARLGMVPTVIDRREGPSGLSRAVGIIPPSMDILAPSGAARAIRKEAVVVGQAQFHAGRFRFASLTLDHGEGAQMLALPQDRTEHHLRVALERYGGRVNFGQALEALTEGPDHVEVRINGEARRFGHVIGADGVGSRVRAAMGVGFEGYDLPETWSIADVEAPGWREPENFQGFFGRQGRTVIVIPLAATRFRLISNTPDALATLPVPMEVERLYRAGTFRISVRQVTAYATARVFLAGDAAHCHSPVGGRGMNLGIADAGDLAARFASGGLAGYHAARHAEGRRVIELSERARKALMQGGALRRGMFYGLMAVMMALPIQRRLAGQVLDV